MKHLLLFFFLCLLFRTNGMSQENYPGFDVIGRGYDIFGEYANAKSVTNYALFDFSKLKKNTNAYGHFIPKFINLTNISDHVVSTIEGSSQKEYIENLSMSLGLTGRAYFFKASVENQLNNILSGSENLFYYTYMDINTKWKIILDTRNIDSLINYLDPQFKSDLDNLVPSELFDLYGTHFIASAYLGGRIDYSTVTEMNELILQSDLRTALTAKYLVVKGSAEYTESHKQTLQNVKTTENFKVIGGNSEYANGVNDKAQYIKWVEGISQTPVLCGFDAKSLKPIWLLTKDLARRTELENYFTSSILPKYPVPNSFAKDEILDNENLTEDFRIHFYGFFIKQDCDYYYLTGDEAGDFSYSIKIYSNGDLVDQFKTRDGYVTSIWSGEVLSLDKKIIITVPLTDGAEIKIFSHLQENDDLQTEDLGSFNTTHPAPFTAKQLSNVNLEGKPYWEVKFYNDSDCEAKLYYQIQPINDPTAVEFGNKGWEEHTTGNYNQALFYYKEALKIDNALWYVHYNVALVYLIQENPRAFDKYKFITEHCPDAEIIRVALEDIKNHESKFGDLLNSEPIELLLNSKI